MSLENSSGKGRWKRYPKYKVSVIESINEVPEGWQFLRFRFICNFIKGKNFETTFSFFKEGFLPCVNMNYLRTGIPEEFINVEKNIELVNDDDLLILWDGSNSGEFIKGRKGVLGSTLVKCKIIPKVSKDYIYYSCKGIEPFLKDNSIGMGIPHVDGNLLKNLPLALPPHSEQTIISTFLDNEIARIDVMMRRKERQIELLNEKRVALISDSLLFGITSTEQLVNAQNTVPKCEYRKVSLFSKIIDCLHQTPEYINDGYPMVRITDINGDYLDLSNTKKISEKHFREFTKNYSPKSGDIIISRVGSIGSVSLVNDNQNFCLGQNTAAIIPRENSKYLFYSFHTNFVMDQFDLCVVGSTLKTLSLDDIKRLKIPYWAPEKQQSISHFLDIATMRVDSISRNVKKSIDYLKEYRTALISAAVTGKIDVRQEISA